MSRVEFPDGNWIEIRTAAEVPEKLRRPYLAQMAVTGRVAPTVAMVPKLAAQGAAERDDAGELVLTRVEVDPGEPGPYMDELRRLHLHGARAVIVEWSWLVPLSFEALEDLPSLAVDMILDATEGARDGIRYSLTSGTRAAAADPKASSSDRSSSDPGWPTPEP